MQAKPFNSCDGYVLFLCQIDEGVSLIARMLDFDLGRVSNGGQVKSAAARHFFQLQFQLHGFQGLHSALHLVAHAGHVRHTSRRVSRGMICMQFTACNLPPHDTII